jgi:hypothetical protein
MGVVHGINPNAKPLVFIEILDGNDEQRNYIEYYFHLGYKYEDIVNLLNIYHGISMSVRTLKRRLLQYDLRKKNLNINEQELRTIIRKEIEGVGQLSGYRKIWHLLRINHHIHAPRKLVAQIVHDLDPQASKERKGNKLKRRKYLSYGPNHCWHIDGMALSLIICVFAGLLFLCVIVRLIQHIKCM